MLGPCPDVPPASEIGDHSYVAYLEVDNIETFVAGRTMPALKSSRSSPQNHKVITEFGLRSPDRHRFIVAIRTPPQ
jgi:hypothetical protein